MPAFELRERERGFTPPCLGLVRSVGLVWHWEAMEYRFDAVWLLWLARLCVLWSFSVLVSIAGLIVFRPHLQGDGR